MNTLFGDYEGLPTWLRDVITRGFGTRKSASDAAIESLVYTPTSDKECPICYEKYEAPKTVQHQDPAPIGPNIDALLVENAQLSGSSRESMASALRFNDPAIFMPADECGSLYSVMPQRNIHSLGAPTLEDCFPGYSGDDESHKRQVRYKELQKEGHVSVKMPNCNHVFGKSCIIEWLKSNVSCPLCREEVEATSAHHSDPRQRKISDIRSSIFARFNDSDAMTAHVANSTDVFLPYATPLNPRVTTLTGSSVPAAWAGEAREGTPDPDLSIPIRYPFPSVPRRTQLRSRRRSVVSDVDDDRVRVHFSPHTTTIGDLNSGSESEEERRGGPERRIRRGRRHPYGRE